jgi:hypothetical protein
VNVFYFIDTILAQPRNNPLHQFDRHTEIETWLREQWAGLFKEMISTRAGQKQIASLAAQVSELSNISTTLKRYLEEVVSRVSEKEAAEKIIESEEQRLAKTRRLEEFKKQRPVSDLIELYNVPFDEVQRIFVTAKSLDHLAHMIEEKVPADHREKSLLEYWRNKRPDAIERMQEARRVLGLPELQFEITKTDAVDRTKDGRKRGTSNKGVQPTPSSVRSAPASGSG